MITPPALTDAGVSLLFRALAGEVITFTRFSAGNGTAAGARDVGNPLIHFPITAAAYPEEGYITLTGSFDSADVEAAFRWKELGVLCEDEDGEEYLYAYANEGENAGLVTPTGSDALTEQQVTVIIAIGSAEHVTARISASTLYAAKDDFDDHVADRTNPHGVTKEQVGLGNVANLGPNDLNPIYRILPVPATPLSRLASGEALSAALEKLAVAVQHLILHLAAKTNPHGVTLAQLKAAAAEHTHSATDITGGTLEVARGGTGGATVASAMEALNIPFQYSGVGYVGIGGPRAIRFTRPFSLILILSEGDGERTYTSNLAVIFPNPGTRWVRIDWSVTGSGTEGYTSQVTVASDRKSVTVDGNLNREGVTYRVFALSAGGPSGTMILST